MGGEAYDRLCADIEANTMRGRVTGSAVWVGHGSPADLRELPWDDAVADLPPEARNASHGLPGMLAEQPTRSRPAARHRVPARFPRWSAS
jgi:hypothetical protein